MPDLEIPGLDDRIRGLVARAVADAPPAPSIDEHTVTERSILQRTAGEEREGRNRWIAGGIAGLSVAAAVVALAFVSRPDEPEAPVAVTQSTTYVVDPMPTTRPTTPTTAMPSTVPSTAVDAATANSTIAPPASTVAGIADPVSPEPASVLVAGAGGVSLELPGAAPQEVTTQRMTDQAARRAVRTGDGSIWIEGYDPEDPEAPGRLLVLAPGATETVAAGVPEALLGRGLRLHDAATVNGEVVLLVEDHPLSCQGFEGCDGNLWAFRPGTGAAELVSTMSVWESGWSDLSLASNGVVVGGVFAQVTLAPYSTVIPSAAAGAAPVDFGALGLEDVYDECSDCPFSFSIDRSGEYVGWIEFGPAGEKQLAIAALATATVDRTVLSGDAIGECCAAPEGDVFRAFASLDLGEVGFDGRDAFGRAMVNLDHPVRAAAPIAVDILGGTTVAREIGTWSRFGE